MNPKEMTFQQLEGSVVIVMKANGSYSQHTAWVRRGEVFVKIGSAYAGMRRHGTSMNGVTLKDYDLGNDEEFSYSHTGRLVLRSSDLATEDTDSFMHIPLEEPEEEVRPKRKPRAKK